MSTVRILVLRAGEPAPALRDTAGDYPAWFAAALSGLDVEMETVAAFQGAPLPSPTGFDAVLMTGSPLSVTVPAPWMDAAGRLMVEAAERGKPVLGVCFGHQLLARHLGGRVERNPRGREIGTIAIRLTETGRAHEVLGTLGEAAHFQATHEDAVLELPTGAQLLAENSFGIQAFAVGSRILGVQFHPELDAARMRALIRTRESVLREEGIYERALAGVRETSDGRTLLARWLEATLR